MRRLFSTALGVMMLSAVVVSASAQTTDQAAREQARSVVRSQLHLSPGQYLHVRRNEELEQLLAMVVSRPSWSEFIFNVSEAGDEIKEHAVVHHIFTDIDPTYTIAISGADGGTHRIRGFADSMDEFQELMTAAKVKVSSADQAEAIAEFYRQVDPECLSAARISSLIELKQAAERQCQTSSFDAGEEAFDSWWKHAKPLYAKMPFGQTAASHGTGYIVQWIVLSSRSPDGTCAGSPLRALLELGPNGNLGRLKFAPYDAGNQRRQE